MIFTQRSASKDGTTNYFLSGLFTVSYPEAAELNFLGDSETCQGLRVVSRPTWRFSLQDGGSGGRTNGAGLLTCYLNYFLISALPFLGIMRTLKNMTWKVSCCKHCSL